MADVTDFFSKENTIKSIPDIWYHSLPQIIADLKSYSRIVYNSIYLVDYYKRSFAYVSDNQLFLCGYTSEMVKGMGFEYFLKHCSQEELERLIEIARAGFAFLKDIPVNERCECCLSYDFSMVSCEKAVVYVNHKFTPFRLSEDGKVWLALCAISFSTKNSDRKVRIYKNCSPYYWEYNFGEKQWIHRAHPQLTMMEKQVISLSAMGLSMEEIADKINRSVDSVKSYRKSIFEKLGVSKIAEAICYTMNHQLI